MIGLRTLLAIPATVAALTVALVLPAGAAAAEPDPCEPPVPSYGVCRFDVTFTGPPPPGSEPAALGPIVSQAGEHPFAMTTSFEVNGVGTAKGGRLLDEQIKDLFATQVPGFAGVPAAVPTCSAADFLTESESVDGFHVSSCTDSSAVGLVKVQVANELTSAPVYSAVYNLAPSPGQVSKLGFWNGSIPVTIEVGLSEEPPYRVIAGPTDVPQLIEVVGSEFTLWGVPADPRHDPLRGRCLEGTGTSAGKCHVSIAEKPFITLPRACRGPLASSYESDSWEHPGTYLPDGRPDLSDPNWVSGSALTHDEAGNPQGMVGCGGLPFGPEISAEPTSKAATSPTGLDFSLDVNDEGLTNPKEGATAASDIEKAEVTLPQGMSVNPSQAEGLAVCSEADVARETSQSAPGAGCPNASKIGSLEVETPLLEDQILKGSLYVATPYENPEHSLLALYIVIKDPELGISVIQPAKVTPDPVTGQLVTTTEEMPQLPFSHFRLHFKEGTRSPLVTPPACGSYTTTAKLTPWSGGAPVHTTSSFEVISGPDNAPCPTGGLSPFHPELQAGTLNNAAGRFSPFNVRITRSDAEQEITHFSIKLPPGIAAKLAGVPFCSDASIARAASRTGPHGGQEELNDPSCPAASQVGRTLAGAGVGPSLAYAPGKIYLAGPYHGSPISLVSITSGVVGPFDIGTVVVRLAIKVNPETGEVFLDSTGSDPIPHIIEGIPVHLRDIRAYTDKPQFTFNPTSCERTSTASTLLGAGLDFASEADDRPVTITSPFQAADCAALPFKPRLSLKLIGGTNRGAHPALKAFLRMNGFGEAGVARAQVTLPSSEFIENAHFNTICTRVQFKEAGGNGEACPSGSIYGWAKAKTPILSEPLEGPVFLRSSEHQLPDVVASLRGQEINVHLVGHVDSVKGRLRNTFETVPDAPVEWASFSFKGQKKGLFVNSTNLCSRVHKAKVEFTGHNGKESDYGAPLKVKCGGKAKKGKKGDKAHRRSRRG